jgi:hypothetical protein
MPQSKMSHFSYGSRDFFRSEFRGFFLQLMYFFIYTAINFILICLSTL